MRDLFDELFEVNTDPWYTEPDFLDIEDEEVEDEVEDDFDDLDLDEWLASTS